MSKYNVGEIVIYDSPVSGENLLQITNRFKSYLVSLHNGEGFRYNQYYDGMKIEISKTNSEKIPLAPKFATGVTTIPENNLRSFEEILA